MLTRLRNLFPRTAAAPQPADERPDRGIVMLRDAMLSGWYNHDTGELYPGFPVDSADVVVDVGCGDGGNLAFCATRGAEVIGIDLDSAALHLAEDKLRSPLAQERGRLHAADAEALPLADATATRVVCAEVLEHVGDPRVAIAELVRIGKPGALYLITVPDEVGEKVQQHRAPRMYFEHPNHVRIFSREDFRTLVATAGLEVLTESRYGFFWTVWWGLFWEAGVDLANAQHPMLDEWTEVWFRLLQSPRGAELKEHLDQVVPKTQVIVARKPPATGEGG